MASSVKPRRVPAVVERAPRPDEPCRPAPAPTAGGCRLRRLAPPPAVDETGHHRAVAGRGAARPRVRPLGGNGSRLHRPMVAVARPQDHRPNDPRDDRRRGSLACGSLGRSQLSWSFRSQGELEGDAGALAAYRLSAPNSLIERAESLARSSFSEYVVASVDRSA